jgi:hypothetical protein
MTAPPIHGVTKAIGAAEVSDAAASPRSVGRALVLSLVHPDFLPSVYSLSFVLRNAGYGVDVVSFSSPVSVTHELGNGIALVDAGPHAGSSQARASARRRGNDRGGSPESPGFASFLPRS